MRRWMLPVIGILLATRPAPGQAKYPVNAFITLPEVEVRSFPGDKKEYATTKLRRGDRVEIVGEFKDDKQWLEIKPPQGSFSWINEKAIARLGSYVVSVKENGTFVRPGSSLSNEPPIVEKVKLSAGTQLEVLPGSPMKTKEGDTFLPIKPPPSEVRYIPAVAVNLPNGVPTVVQNQTPVTPNPPTTLYALSNPTLQAAEAAYRGGEHERAKLLFKQVYENTAIPWEQRHVAYNYLTTLSGPTKSTWQPGPGNVAGQTTSATRPLSTSQYNNPAISNLLNFAPEWSAYGRLRPTAYQKDGLPRYVLEDERLNPVMYVTAAPGLSLSAFVGRRIALYGPSTYNSEARVKHMTATHVALP